MSINDVRWNRLLFFGAGLSILNPAIIIFVVMPQVEIIPPIKSQMILLFSSPNLLIAGILLTIGFINKRDVWYTKALLIFAGVYAVLFAVLFGMFLLIFIAVESKSEMILLWKFIIVCAIGNFCIGIITFHACIKSTKVAASAKSLY